MDHPTAVATTDDYIDGTKGQNETLRPPNTSDVIDLNIGGHLFSTSRQTLLADPSSMLSRMFAPDSQFGFVRDGKSRVFIDRDGTQFRHILNYLRSNGDASRMLLPTDLTSLQELLHEAKYYMLDGLVSCLEGKLPGPPQITDFQPSSAVRLQTVSSAQEKWPEYYHQSKAQLLLSIAKASQSGLGYAHVRMPRPTRQGENNAADPICSVLHLELLRNGYNVTNSGTVLHIRWLPDVTDPEENKSVNVTNWPANIAVYM